MYKSVLKNIFYPIIISLQIILMLFLESFDIFASEIYVNK